jgi:hypothetical protein
MNSRAGMYYHSSRLIDGHQAAVFVEYVERNVFGRSVERRGFRRFHLDSLSGPHRARGTPGISVHPHAAPADPLLNARAAVLRQTLMHHLIQTFAGVFRLRP